MICRRKRRTALRVRDWYGVDDQAPDWQECLYAAGEVPVIFLNTLEK